MNIQKYLEEMKRIQSILLEFLDETNNSMEEHFENIIVVFDEYKIGQNPHELRSVLHLILTIANNHMRNANFFTKIEKILNLFKNEISRYFSNYEIFNIFKSNKRILLFFIEEKKLVIDERIVNLMNNDKYIEYEYIQYFSPEIHAIVDNFSRDKINRLINKFPNIYEGLLNEIQKDFYEKRKEGENDDYICQLIRKDLIKEFIAHANKTDLNLNSTIKSSFYETNSFLLRLKKISHTDHMSLYNRLSLTEKTTLIEYAAFCGSIQIFNYLKLNGANLTPTLWFYSIHGRNGEILHILEEKFGIPKEISHLKLLSIKCHHNDIYDYIVNNYSNENEERIFNSCIQFYNFNLMNDNNFDESNFYHVCKYDYYTIAKDLLNKYPIDVNKINDIKNDVMKWSEFEYLGGHKIWAVIDSESIKKTALYAAIEKENIEITKLLLNNEKIDVNIVNKESNNIWEGIGTIFNELVREKTALYVAVEKENTEIVKLLLNNKNIDVNAFNLEQAYSGGGETNEWKRTALFAAVDKENVEIVKALLAKDKINVNIPSKEFGDWSGGVDDDAGIKFKSPLYEAIFNKNIEIAKLLLDKKEINLGFINTGFKNSFYIQSVDSVPDSFGDEKNVKKRNEKEYDDDDNEEYNKTAIIWEKTAFELAEQKLGIDIAKKLFNKS